MNGLPSRKITLPSESAKAKLLEFLEEGYPTPVAESFARVDPGVTSLLIDMGKQELRALELEVATGQVPAAELEDRMAACPLISWGLRAEHAATAVLRKAYDNVNESIHNGNLTSSKWLISRNVMTAKDQAILDLYKVRAYNERLQILTKLKEHSEPAYRAALKEMGLEEHVAMNPDEIIKRINAEIRRDETKEKNKKAVDAD